MGRIYDSPRQTADEFQTEVIDGLQRAFEFCHWLAVIRQKQHAVWLEYIIGAVLKAARSYKGELVRGEE